MYCTRLRAQYSRQSDHLSLLTLAVVYVTHSPRKNAKSPVHASIPSTHTYFTGRPLPVILILGPKLIRFKTIRSLLFFSSPFTLSSLDDRPSSPLHISPTRWSIQMLLPELFDEKADILEDLEEEENVESRRLQERIRATARPRDVSSSRSVLRKKRSEGTPSWYLQLPTLRYSDPGVQNEKKSSWKVRRPIWFCEGSSMLKCDVLK